MTTIHPELQFKPTDQNVLALLARYKIEKCSWELAQSGIQNVTIIVIAGKEKYVLRVYRKGGRSLDSIKQEIDFIKFLKESGLPVVTFKENLDGDLLTTVNIEDTSWQCVLMDFASGEHVSNYSTSLIHELARMQALFHQKAAQYCENRVYTGKVRHLPSYYSPIPEPRKYSDEVEAFLQRAKDYNVKVDSLPAGMIHADFDIGNILVNGSTVTAILDFDDMAFAPLAVCLGNTLWHVFVTSHDWDSVRLYVDEYRKVRSLAVEELTILPRIMLIRHYVIGLLSATIWDSSEEDITTLLPQEAVLLNMHLDI